MKMTVEARIQGYVHLTKAKYIHKRKTDPQRGCYIITIAARVQLKNLWS
jgi:hypothetical protein